MRQKAGETLTHGRLAGCQSTNHTTCYGDLWQCARCAKIVCYAEGTDNLPALCDDCWVTQVVLPRDGAGSSVLPQAEGA